MKGPKDKGIKGASLLGRVDRLKIATFTRRGVGDS